jgi:flagellar basal body rod protein FlgF
MSLAEVLPKVQSLSRLDKIRLIQFLAQELERDDDGLIEPGKSYPVGSPDPAFTAAAALLQALEDEKGQP